MFRCMKEQAENRARELASTNTPGFAEAFDGRMSQLLECPVDLREHSCDERRCGSTAPALLCERGALRLNQRVTSRVREEPVEASGHVLQVVSRACRLAWTMPQLVWSRGGRDSFHIFPRLQ
jgi:hypothetical protein